MLASAGGFGLGLVTGWLAATIPRRVQGPTVAAPVIFAALAAEAALLGGAASAAWFVLAVLAGVALRAITSVLLRRD